MSKSSKIIWGIALIVIIVLIGVVVASYIKKATFKPENPVATMEVENFGTIKMELYPDVAPETVSNFIALANRGFYNDLTFHRIVKDFMIQGGDKNGDGKGNANLSDLKEGGEEKAYTIKGEFNKNNVTNELKIEEGTLAMARASYSYDTASSQFFIVTKESENNTNSLYGQYAVFGKVIEGMDVVHKIEEVEVTAKEGATEVSTPVNAPKITSITVDTKGIDYETPETMDPPVDYSSYYQQLGLDPSQVMINE